MEVPPGKPGPKQWKTRWETAGQPRSIGNLCREPTPFWPTGPRGGTFDCPRGGFSRALGAWRLEYEKIFPDGRDLLDPDFLKI
jgi:hypothetical protein